MTEPDNLPPAPGLANATLRQVVQPALGGEKLRLRLSNAHGDRPLELREVRVAESRGGGAIRIETDTTLRFGGNRSVTIAAGAEASSDEVDFSVSAFTNLAVSISIGAAPDSHVTGHPGSRTTSYLQVGPCADEADLSSAAQVDHWYFLSHIDVWTDARARAVVAVGDSITDGRGSTTNHNDRWPNRLSKRLLAVPQTALVSVVNQGIGGNRVLSDGLGPSLLSRFGRDVFGVPNARWVILFEGINDLGTAADGEPIADRLIAAYSRLIDSAHERGLSMYGATIMPFEGSAYYSASREQNRQLVNAWIRDSGRFDAVIDFDAIARDPVAPRRLRAAVDGGDHLHPSAQGYEIMAGAIDLALFQL